MTKKKQLKTLAASLHRISTADRPLSLTDVQALHDLVADLAKRASTDLAARLLWLRASFIQEHLTGQSTVSVRDGSGLPAAADVGRVRGLTQARHEVLGGLPGSRRRH